MEELTIRAATADDVPAIVAMLADDNLGATRESLDDMAPYQAAFRLLAGQHHQHLVVAERDSVVVGTLQLTIVPGLSLRGSTRSIIEGVRIHRQARGNGLGTQLISWAIDRSRDEGCSLVQLATNAGRKDAHRFYERHGFVGSHIGFKLNL